jgi:hypothetical protein
MKIRRLTFGMALLAIVCVLLVVLFPAVQGPYSAVHGPVTVMHAARTAAWVRMAVARAGLQVVPSYPSTSLGRLFVRLSWPAAPDAEFLSRGLLAAGDIPFRC